MKQKDEPNGKLELVRCDFLYRDTDEEFELETVLKEAGRDEQDFVD